MLYVLYGTDQDKARAKAHELIDSLLKKRPDASFFKLDTENFKSEQFEEYLAGQGLFVNKYIVFCDRLGENKDIRDYLEDKLKEIKASDNIFIVLEESFLAALKKKIEKNAEKVQEFELPEKKVAKKEFNMFALTDALGARDRKSLWVLYRQAVDHGSVSEEIHGILFWQVKSLLLAVSSPDAKTAGLNPFVYGKARNYAKNFKTEELKEMSQELVTMYHRAHRGEIDFERTLEKWVLEI